MSRREVSRNKVQASRARIAADLASPEILEPIRRQCRTTAVDVIERRPTHLLLIASGGLRLGPTDIMLQLLDHELPVADDAFDQIPDRDDAEKLAIIDHRQVAHALGAHDCHAFLD
jgi:hypothetical protein